MQGLFTVWLLTFALFCAAALARVRTRFFVAPTVEVKRHRAHPDHPLLRMVADLELTAAQRSDVDRILQSALPRLERLGRATRESLANLMTMSPADEDYPALVRAAKSSAAAQIQFISEVQAQIVDGLTDAQRAKLLELTRRRAALRAA